MKVDIMALSISIQCHMLSVVAFKYLCVECIRLNVVMLNIKTQYK